MNVLSFILMTASTLVAAQETQTLDFEITEQMIQDFAPSTNIGFCGYWAALVDLV